MNMCGILPVLSYSLGLPYPDVLYPLTEGELVLDRSLGYLKSLGVEVVYIPCTPKVCEYLTNLIFYERMGMEIRYVQMDVKDPLRFLTFAIKAARRAAYIHAFSKFAVVDATKVFSSTQDVLKMAELPFYTDVPHLSILDDDTVTALRKHIKSMDDENAYCAALGTRKVTTGFEFCDFTDWSQVKAYHYAQEGK